MEQEKPCERPFRINLTLKPLEPGLKLRPIETQLLLAYMGEILQEVEIEEKRIIEEERKAAQEVTMRVVRKEDKSCK